MNGDLEQAISGNCY